MRKFLITVQGTTYEVDVEEVAAGMTATPAMPVAAPVLVPKPVTVPEAAPVISVAAAATPKAVASPMTGGEKVKAPMPGTILSVHVQAGAEVRKGDILCILEAMKMENEILSPCDGKAAQVLTSKGASVNPGDVLFVIA